MQQLWLCKNEKVSAENVIDVWFEYIKLTYKLDEVPALPLINSPAHEWTTSTHCPCATS